MFAVPPRISYLFRGDSFAGRLGYLVQQSLLEGGEDDDGESGEVFEGVEERAGGSVVGLM